ncbi:MAG: ParB/RepB/Spo0J family partition protein [Polyangia bacterium]
MSQQFKDENGPLHQSQQDAEHEDRPADDRPEENAPTPAEAKSGADIQLSPGEPENPRSLLEGDYLAQARALLRGATSAPQATLAPTEPSSEQQSPQSRQDAEHEDRPADDRPEENAPTPAEAESGAEIQLSPGELENRRKLRDGDYLAQARALLRKETPAPPATLPLAELSSDEKSPLSSDIARRAQKLIHDNQAKIDAARARLHQQLPVLRGQPEVASPGPDGHHRSQADPGSEAQPTSDRPGRGAHGDARDPAETEFRTTDEVSQRDAENVLGILGLKFPPETSGVSDGRGPAQPAPIPPLGPLETGPAPVGKSDGSAKQQHQTLQYGLDRAYNDMHKRLNGKRHQREVAQYGPQGEARSVALIKRVESIKLDKIIDDPNFQNCRLTLDKEKLRELAASMACEGLNDPVTVVEAPGDRGEFLLRKGFRRTTAARSLGWREIPAIILPKDTPVVEEHWINIIENTARSNLSTYEIANAARVMRDDYGVGASDFAARAAYKESYIWKLLRCIDKLPAVIIEQWQAGAPIPVELLAEWTALSPVEAIEQFHIFTAQRRKGTKQYMPSPRERIKNSPLMTATNFGLKRMHGARFAIEVAPNLDEETRAKYLSIVDFCMGAKEVVPGIYDPAMKQRQYKSRRRKGDPKMPDPANADDAGEPSSGQEDK